MIFFLVMYHATTKQSISPSKHIIYSVSLPAYYYNQRLNDSSGVSLTSPSKLDCRDALRVRQRKRAAPVKVRTMFQGPAPI